MYTELAKKGSDRTEWNLDFMTDTPHEEERTHKVNTHSEHSVDTR